MNVGRERRGSVLVQAALLLVGMMGVAALIVDIGIVRATQGSMVVAADVAALEGLRGRDAIVLFDDGCIPPPGQIQDLDLRRRGTASAMARRVYADDVNPIAPGSFGAGPQIETGAGAVAAPAGGVLSDNGAYVPNLQLNVNLISPCEDMVPAEFQLLNEQHGDMVAGNFNPNPGQADWHSEFADYSRADFQPFIQGVDSYGTAQDRSFLARLRRTRDAAGLDELAGVSSSGPTLPFLFGFGTALGATDSEVYDPRRDGLTVRATSIADARYVLAAGLANQASPGLSGLIYLGDSLSDGGLTRPRVMALEASKWLEMPVGVIGSADTNGVCLQVEQDGEIVSLSDGGEAVGRAFLVPPPESCPEPMPPPGLVGVGMQELPSASPFTLNEDVAYLQGNISYVALYLPSPGQARIAGFGAVEILPPMSCEDEGVAADIRIRRLGLEIAPRNASAVPSLACDLGALDDLLDWVAMQPDPDSVQPLRAPVLAR